MKSVEEIKNRINELAPMHRSFLFAFDYEMKNGFLIEDPLCQTDVLWRVPGYSNFQSQPVAHHLLFKPQYTDYATYRRKFDIIHQGLMHGDSFLTNLTIKTPIECDYSFTEIIKASNSPYALMIADRLVCFSPETFVKINKEGVISSYPMKGTIDATLPNAKEIILSDYKESAEHYTIVDLIRSDLSRASTQVNVSRLRYIDQLNTSKGSILQVSSEIQGQLPAGYLSKLGNIIMELLPAGSISGAPKPMTVDLIRRAEGEDRGFYCGVFGYFNGYELDSAVMIRYIEKQDGKLYFRSGSGITINSNCESEYNEVNQKVYLPFI